ncbi:MAG: Vms1/Ankzf1 family peptidyl-tRNA hydrolase, partial [Dehalococcoidales bacterium]|nr:Vms1/Ankzf1 family peptidyl-tRNA hydrolase [Dehalococcoidales bacterium]
TGLVHSRHRQGGSSAARFQRRREDQTHHFLERVGGHIREIFEPYAKKLDNFVYGGARTTIQQLQKQCDFLRQFDDRLLPPLLEIPDPRFRVLETAITQVWSSRVTEWRDSEVDS